MNARKKLCMLANFFILMCSCGVLAKYAVFYENARGITLAHYIYMYIDEQTLSFSLSLSPYLSIYVLLCFFSVFFVFLFFYSSRKARIFGYTNTGARLPQRTS